MQEVRDGRSTAETDDLIRFKIGPQNVVGETLQLERGGNFSFSFLVGFAFPRYAHKLSDGSQRARLQ